MCARLMCGEIPNINSHTQFENANRDDIEVSAKARQTTQRVRSGAKTKKKRRREKQKSKPHVWLLGK